MTETTNTLWINQTAGGCVCPAHAGRQLQSAISAKPKAKTHITTFGKWVLANAEDRAYWLAEMGGELCCEVCEAQAPKAASTARPVLTIVQ